MYSLSTKYDYGKVLDAAHVKLAVEYDKKPDLKVQSGRRHA